MCIQSAIFNQNPPGMFSMLTKVLGRMMSWEGKILKRKQNVKEERMEARKKTFMFWGFSPKHRAMKH